MLFLIEKILQFPLRILERDNPKQRFRVTKKKGNVLLTIISPKAFKKRRGGKEGGAVSETYVFVEIKILN